MFPLLLQLGPITIPTQGALIALGLLAGLLLIVHTARMLLLDVDCTWNLALTAILGFILGGRFILIATHWHEYLHYPALLLVVSIHSPAILIGGTAIALTACAITQSLHPVPKRRTLDALAAPIALACSFAAFGAFAAGADFGTPTSLPWAVRFHSHYAAMWSHTPQDVPLHPVQLYQAGFELSLCGLLLMLMYARGRHDGDIFGAFLLLDGTARFLLEFLRGSRGTELLDAQQVIALLMIAASGILWWETKRVMEYYRANAI